MSNELVQFELPGDLVQASKFATEGAFKSMSGSGFLPRIQLISSSSKLAKKGEVPQGTYATLQGKERVTNKLGDKIHGLLVGWRPKAIRFDGPKPKAFYDPNSEGFKQTSKDSSRKGSKALFGPEFLVYLPSIRELCVMHFNNPTMRQSAGPLFHQVGKPVTFGVELIENNDHSWHGPTITACTTPLTFPEGEEREKLMQFIRIEQNKFNNPKTEEDVEEGVEEATEPSSSRDR